MKEAGSQPPAMPLHARQLSWLAAICFAAGLAIGYVALAPLLVGPEPAPAATAVPADSGNAGPVSLAAMKDAADRQALPLLQRLSASPGDPATLARLGALYHIAHQYKQAAGYYGEAVRADPENVVLRSKFAASLYRSGDADGALAQLNKALHDAPDDANTLFNLGTIRLEAKGDADGALDAWQRLLKSNPRLSPERRAMVEELIADLRQGRFQQSGPQGGTRHGSR